MLKWLLRLSLILAVLLPARAADCCKNTVAMVESLKGQVTIRLPGATTDIVASGLEWLPAGTAVEVHRESSATLILINGHHYELRGGAKATVTADGLSRTTGLVRELKALPPIPKFVPIVDDAESVPGAVRFRGPNDPQDLYPRAGAAALASSLKLLFSPVRDASAYDVTLEDEAGQPLLSERTASTSLAVPPDKLRDGAHYSWHVRAIGSAGVLGQGAAEFVTLSREDIEQRTHFAQALAGVPEASRLALLADVDLRLGLIAEARAEFQAALRLNPSDAAIQGALESRRFLPAERGTK